MSAIDASAAAALVAAAAGAAGLCPPEPAARAAWERRVIDGAYGLIRLLPVVEALADCTSVTGVVLSVKEHSGRGVITIRPTIGNPEPGKTEDFRTPFLNDAMGQAMFDQARSLIGHHCRFAKRVEEIEGGRKKVRMCEAIEDLGAASGSATVPDGRETGNAPAAAPPVPPAADDPFRPFDESDMTLAGPTWARKFKVAMTASGHGPRVQEAVVHYATGGTTRAAESVLRTQAHVVAATHQRLDAGELVTSTDDSGRIVLAEATTARGAA